MFEYLLFKHILIVAAQPPVDYYFNYNLTNIETPIKVEELEKLLVETNYDEEKRRYLIDGFTKGFDIGNRGPVNRQNKSKNIPIRVGSKADMWSKIMKEVKANHYAGPFKEVPFENYMQSPIGLVPKAGNQKTRLIFHLSYDFSEDRKSLNYHTPENLCKVRYNDLDHAVTNCLKLIEKCKKNNINFAKRPLVFAKIDIRSAFRLVPV